MNGTEVVDAGAIITNIVLSLLGLAVTALSGFAAAFLRSKLNANQVNLLHDIAKHVVLAVEQNTYGSELAADGAAKKSLAMDLASSLLEKYGVHITGEQLSAVIESAVASELNWDKIGGTSGGVIAPVGPEAPVDDFDDAADVADDTAVDQGDNSSSVTFDDGDLSQG